MSMYIGQTNYQSKAHFQKGAFLMWAAVMALLCVALVACTSGGTTRGKTSNPQLPDTGRQGVIVGGPQVLQPEWRASTLGLMSTTARMSGGAASQPETSQPDCRSLPYGSQILHISCKGTGQ